MTDNVDTIRRGFAAFATGDMDTLREVFDSEIAWHEPGRSSISGDYQGIDATLTFFGELFERSSGTFRADLLECGEIAPGLVACLIHAHGTTTAGSLDQRGMLLFQVQDGRAVEVWNFSSDQHAQDAAWGPASIALPDAQKQATPSTT